MYLIFSLFPVNFEFFNLFSQNWEFISHNFTIHNGKNNVRIVRYKLRILRKESHNYEKKMKSVLQDVSSEFIKKRATVTFLFGGKK